MNSIILNKRISILMSFLLVILTSCTSIKLISDYDELTDKKIVALQEKVTGFVVKIRDEIGTDKAKYVNYKPFYQEVKVDLETLKIRTNAIDNNKIVQDQVATLAQYIDNLEKVHKLGFNDVSEVDLINSQCNTIFTALTKLQLGLKRGEKK
ncbi:hypothetical protein J2787_002600 [Chryseobacterium rhizosphaerae]|uniref:Uncharacterized protein n=1 Tax=Chryseobacterium rhizosphaerae TaxID=395937 RepID=A0AAE4C345_9FLAO|nr:MULTISPECIES: hypothetical protein [Chryseobacterium]MDR6527208.1 hypothetical protein [Chryseobacterium rhizosphaerae]